MNWIHLTFCPFCPNTICTTIWDINEQNLLKFYFTTNNLICTLQTYFNYREDRSKSKFEQFVICWYTAIDYCEFLSGANLRRLYVNLLHFHCFIHLSNLLFVFLPKRNANTKKDFGSFMDIGTSHCQRRVYSSRKFFLFRLLCISTIFHFILHLTELC